MGDASPTQGLFNGLSDFSDTPHLPFYTSHQALGLAENSAQNKMSLHAYAMIPQCILGSHANTANNPFPASHQL